MTTREIRGDLFATHPNADPRDRDGDAVVRLSLTQDESAGYIAIGVSGGVVNGPLLAAITGGESIAHFSPASARELALSLLDLADIADIDAGTYEGPGLDPFEAPLAQQTAAQTDKSKEN